MDFLDLWDGLNPYAGFVYSLGDYNCHQKDVRSFYLNDNQLPVCARDTGLALGFLFGSILFMLTIPVSDPFRMALTPFLEDRVFSMSRGIVILISLILAAIFMAPMAYDGLAQTFTDYESTNNIRFITGTLFGAAMVLALGSYMESYIYKHMYEKRHQKDSS